MRSKIEIDGSILEQVKQFNYLGCELSLDGEPDFDKKKISNFQGICGNAAFWTTFKENPYRYPNETL